MIRYNPEEHFALKSDGFVFHAGVLVFSAQDFTQETFHVYCYEADAPACFDIAANHFIDVDTGLNDVDDNESYDDRSHRDIERNSGDHKGYNGPIDYDDDDDDTLVPSNRIGEEDDDGCELSFNCACGACPDPWGEDTMLTSVEPDPLDPRNIRGVRPRPRHS